MKKERGENKEYTRDELIKKEKKAIKIAATLTAISMAANILLYKAKKESLASDLAERMEKATKVIR